jgi:hypothetical protein
MQMAHNPTRPGNRATITAPRLVAVATAVALVTVGGVVFRDDGSGSNRAENAAAAAAAPSPRVAETGPDQRRASSAYGIWDWDSEPTSRVSSSTRPRTFGTEFKARAHGTVKALRYFTRARGQGRVVGLLYTGDGEQLAKARFGRVSTVGWQRAVLTKPVNIRKGKPYVVAYYAPRGRPTQRGRVFAGSGVVRSAALVATSGRVGGKSGFPRRGSSTAFFADVEFRPALRFPTAETAGVPARWRPERTITGRDKVIRRNGAVVEDLRVVNGDILVEARNVTIRRVEVLGGSIGNWSGPTCSDGLVIRSTTVARAPDQVTSDEGPAISTGSYKAIDVKIDDLPEGFRVGGKPEGCGPVVIKDSYARVTAPDQCGDWHGDALQGYEGDALTIRNSRLALEWRDDCEGTASFFYPDQGNTSVDINGLLVEGSRYYSFRLHTPGEVRNLKVLTGPGNGGIDVDCDLLSAWSAHEVELDRFDQPRNLRRLPCD